MCDRSRRQESIDAFWEARAFVEQHIEARRNNLGDDFTSVMIRQQMEGLLTQEELITQAMSLLQASMDNTVHQLGLTFGTLLEDSARWAQLLAQPTKLGSAIEETIRLRPRFGTIFRYAPDQVHFEDVTIPRDSWVFVSVRSANRDELAFPAGDEFRLDRPTSRALMFGNGPYNCLGQTLARLELNESIRAVMKRFPGIRMQGEWRVHDSNAVSETAHLRVSLV
jgi:cytochrome P450